MPVSKPLGAGCSHHAPCLRFRKDASSHGFRGEQYSHAIALFQRKFANSAPPNIDVLVDSDFSGRITRRPPPATAGATPAGTVAGIVGVTSKSAEASIRSYNGRTHDNERALVSIALTQRVGTAAPDGCETGR